MLVFSANPIRRVLRSMQKTDEQLVEHWKTTGDRATLAELADRYLPQFFGTARGLMLSPDEAEDVTQEAMLKVFRSIDAFDTKASFRTWSYTVLINTIRSRKTRQWWYVRRHDASFDITNTLSSDACDQPKFALDETRTCFEQALQKLTEKQRSAIVLMVMEGMTAAQVAEIEHCSVDAIYQRVAEARRSLRKEPQLKLLWE